MDQNADGTSDENALTMPNGFTGLTPGDVYAVPTPQPTAPIINFFGFLTSGTPTVSVFEGTTGLSDGEVVTGTGIPVGTTIVSIDSLSSTITLSANATANGFEQLLATGEFVFKHRPTPAGQTWAGTFSVHRSIKTPCR